MPFTFEPTDTLPEVVEVVPQVFEDERGWFMEALKASDFAAAGIEGPFVQANLAHSDRKGTLRGLHYQNPPHAQGKLVRCIAGAVFDVAVDIRRGSGTFGQWVGRRLDAGRQNMLWIPPGFAHGLQTLEDETQVEYMLTAEYAPESEAVVRWDDPAIGIEWPVREPVLAARDAEAPLLEDAANGFTVEASP